MPVFHFNVFDGVTIIDKEGSELPDMTFARREAIRYSGALLEEGFDKGGDFGKEWRMEVTDGAGLILFRLDFHVSDAPAAIRTTVRES